MDTVDKNRHTNARDSALHKANKNTPDVFSTETGKKALGGSYAQSNTSVEDGSSSRAISSGNTQVRTRKRSPWRLANGIVSAALVCFFFAHATLGSLQGFLRIPSPASWIIWAGMVFVGVHMLLCIATSFEQLTDTVRPPSIEKKRHLVLKWATGFALLAVAGIHIWRVREMGLVMALHSVSGAAWTIALAVLLAMHIWTGSKSLLKDLGVNRRWRDAVRAGACAFAVLFGALALAHLVGQ